MEQTKNEMPPYAKVFFKKLSNYLNTKMYFFGSIQRYDYIPNFSDIDVDIFTDNFNSTIIKLQSFLNLNRTDFKHFIYNLHKSKKIVYGYKVEYEDKINNFTTEISIYNEKNKEEVLKEHQYKIFIPFYISYLLYFVKFLYYKLHILPKKLFKKLKNVIINYMVDGSGVEFVVTDFVKKII
jgi:hypothetical protein